MAVDQSDTWSAGKLYEPYVGRWSRRVARDFLQWIGAKPQLEWLDVGCGTGALTAAIVETMQPRRVLGVDPSAAFIAYARETIRSEHATFEVADARSLPVEDARFDASVSGLVVNFVPEPPKAVQEMARTVRRAGTVAAYVWDYADKMELMRYFWDAAGVLDPAAHALDEGRRFPMCQPSALGALFEAAGLRDVQTSAVEIPTVFRDFDDYWSPFLGGQGPAPGYAMSLTEERRNALRDKIRTMLPIAPDGSISLVARAWAVRGRRS